MSVRIGWWWVALVVAWCGPAGFAGPAAAECQQCTEEMFCAVSPTGGSICLGSGNWCAMAGRCGTRRGYFDNFGMVQLSLLEGTASGAGTRVRRGHGPVAVGDHARRAAGGAALVFSAVGTIDGASALFRAPEGDGFVLRREAVGRGARVVVRALDGERPGRVLADERLDEFDALVTRVRFGGRERVLVVQASTLGAAESREHSERVRREIARAMPLETGAPTGELPFELRAIDE